MCRLLFVQRNVTRRKNAGRQTVVTLCRVTDVITSSRLAVGGNEGWRMVGEKPGGNWGMDVSPRWPCCCPGRMWALVRPHTHTCTHTHKQTCILTGEARPHQASRWVIVTLWTFTVAAPKDVVCYYADIWFLVSIMVGSKLRVFVMVGFEEFGLEVSVEPQFQGRNWMKQEKHVSRGKLSFSIHLYMLGH